MNWKRIKKITIIELIIALLIFITIVSFSNSLNIEVKNNISEIQEFNINSIDKAKFTFFDFFNIKNQLDKYKISCYSEELSEVSNENLDVQAVLVYIDENYKDVFKQNLIRGSYIDRDEVVNGSKVVIISEELAVKAFKSIDNVVGKEIKINKEIFTIVGVYEEDDSFIYNLSKDPYDRMYIPFTSFSNSYEKEVCSFGVKCNDRTNNIIRNINEVSSGKIRNYDNIDNELYIKFSCEGMNIIIFLIAAIISLVIVKYCYKLGKSNYIYFKEKAKRNYFKSLLVIEKRRIIINLIKILISISIILVLIGNTLFEVTVIDKYLPEDNIFSIEEYKEVILEEVQEDNINNSYKGRNEKYINTIILIQIINTIILIALIIYISILVYKVKILYNYKKKDIGIEVKYEEEDFSC